MDGTSRQQAIVNILKEDNSVKILELSKRLKVTRETIRRDLYELEKKGLVKTVRGGAVLNAAVNETSYSIRLNQNRKVKAAIADEFAKRIEPGDIIYLDYGTTSLAVAKRLSRMKNITIVTNSIPIMNVLYKVPSIELVVLGGLVRHNEGSLSGRSAENILNEININIGFISGSGLTVKNGLSNHLPEEASLTRQAIKQCQQIAVGVDHEKFGNVFLNKIVAIKDIDVLITDHLTDKNLVKELKAQTNLVFTDPN